MRQSPIRYASGVIDGQADTQQASPGTELPGLWRRAAPQLQPTLSVQMADLGRTAQSSWPDLARHSSLGFFPVVPLQPQKSVRDQYTLPGQVERTGSMTVM